MHAGLVRTSPGLPNATTKVGLEIGFPLKTAENDFQPLKSIFEAGAVAGGGSDHMQKIGSFRSINPYNPFLGMWVTITRKAKWFDGQLHPEEALGREQALRFYTINNAYLMFMEKDIGSLETNKLADLIVIDRDVLTCPVDEIKDTKVLRTYVGGKLVYGGK